MTMHWEVDFFSPPGPPFTYKATGATHVYYLRRTDDHGPAIMWQLDVYHAAPIGPVHGSTSWYASRGLAKESAETIEAGPDLIGPAVAARIADLSEATIRTYVRRGTIVKPLPVAGSDALIWRREAIEDWAARERRPGRPRKDT